MNRLHTIACTLGLLLLGACATTFGHREVNWNPDERLASLMKIYEQSKNGTNDADHLVIDCDRARNEIERLSVDFPRHVPTLMANAAIAYDERDPVKAQRYLDALFHVQPVHAEAAILRSRISIAEGNLQAARRMLEQQAQYAPDHAALHEALSAVLYMAGDIEHARAELDMAAGLGAPAWRIAYNRGLIAEKAGDKAQAQKEFEAALAGNADFKPAQARLAGMRASGGYNGNPSPPARAGAPPAKAGGQ